MAFSCKLGFSRFSFLTHLLWSLYFLTETLTKSRTHHFCQTGWPGIAPGLTCLAPSICAGITDAGYRAWLHYVGQGITLDLPLLLLPPLLELQMLATMPGFTTWVQGIELRFPYLATKNFSHCLPSCTSGS